MKVLLCADRKVGLEITRFMVSRYSTDLVLVLTVDENEIFRTAQEGGVPVKVFRDEPQIVAELKAHPFDLGLLAWWPKLISPTLLELPRLGFINTHPSLLPYNRGKHYNFWAIVEEAPFGVSLHWVDNGVDTGDIVAQAKIDYDWCDTGGTLYRKAQDKMIELFRETYPKLLESTIPRIPQGQSIGSAHKARELDRASHIDLDGNYRARDLLNRLRARTFPGHPACWFEEDGQKYEVRIDIQKVDK